MIFQTVSGGSFTFLMLRFSFQKRRPKKKLTLSSEEAAEEDYKEWMPFSMMMLEQRYDEDEPEYPLDLIKEKNPDYEGDNP